MKSLIFIWLFASTMALVAPNLGAISKAITKGDASALAQYFDEDVEVTILNDVNIYSRSEAKEAVEKFFAKHPPKTYSQVHQGTSKGQGGQYCIGNLVVNSGKFRVYIYLKKSDDKYRIQELRFEEE